MPIAFCKTHHTPHNQLLINIVHSKKTAASLTFVATNHRVVKVFLVVHVVNNVCATLVEVEVIVGLRETHIL